MKTKIKLNRSRLDGMYVLIDHLLSAYKPKDKAEKLLGLLVEKVWIKMRNRLQTYKPNDTYSVLLSPEEAIAFAIWFDQQAIDRTIFQYECNVATQLLHEIDRLYSFNTGIKNTHFLNK